MQAALAEIAALRTETARLWTERETPQGAEVFSRDR
jgi:hypothetical protein